MSTAASGYGPFQGGGSRAAGVRLHNIATGHDFTLGTDNIREYRTPDFLLLRCQLTLRGPAVLIEPTLGP